MKSILTAVSVIFGVGAVALGVSHNANGMSQKELTEFLGCQTAYQAEYGGEYGSEYGEYGSEYGEYGDEYGSGYDDAYLLDQGGF